MIQSEECIISFIKDILLIYIENEKYNKTKYEFNINEETFLHILDLEDVDLIEKILDRYKHLNNNLFYFEYVLENNKSNKESICHVIFEITNKNDEYIKKMHIKHLLSLYEKEWFTILDDILDCIINTNKDIPIEFKSENQINYELISYTVNYFRKKLIDNKVNKRLEIDEPTFKKLIKNGDCNLIGNLLEFDKKNLARFNNYESYLEKSIEGKNEKLAELFLSHVLAKDQCVWTCKNKILFKEVFEKEWWGCVEKFLDITAFDFNDTNFLFVKNLDKNKSDDNQLKKIIIKINEENKSVKVNKDLTSIADDNDNTGEGIKLLKNENSNNECTIPMKDIDNKTNNPKIKYSFFYLDSFDGDISKSHPLIKIAQSGKHHLIEHEATLGLLKLKWRFIPRFLYYLLTIFYILFMILFIDYSFDTINTNVVNQSLFNSSDASEILKQKDNFTRFMVSYLSCIFFIFEIFQIIDLIFKEKLVGFLSYFLDIKNILELTTCSLSLISLQKSEFLSITIVFGFLVIIFRLEKMVFIGKYAVAFRKTIKKSIFMFPIFITLWLAFVRSFQIQSNFGIEYFQNESFRNSSIKTLSMVAGDLQTSAMGIERGHNSFIYLLFIIIMMFLFNNLFVGIAVGELSKVIKESKIIHIRLRIEYVIKTQQFLTTFNYPNLIKVDSGYQEDPKWVKNFSKKIKYLKDNLKNKFKNYNTELISVKDSLDCLKEMTINNQKHFSILENNMRELNKKMIELKKNQNALLNFSNDLVKLKEERLTYVNN